MKVYAGMDPRLDLADVIAHATRVEALGYDGLHVAETVHDAFGLALLVAEHTERITVRTSMALAFVRSPTLTAYAAWDLSKFSRGRFELGLGTQIRQNIEDRYGMPFSADPVGQLGDYVGAVRAAFAAFRTGERPHYESTHYALTRMQPYFNPGPDHGTLAPAIYLGGVQRPTCALAGAVADGFVTHPTNSDPLYLETTCRPGLAEGAVRAGRVLSQEGFELVIGTQAITGITPEAVRDERERQRRLLAFLYSTPAYRPTLELYGWGELAPRLRARIRDDRWDDLADVLPDEVLDTLVPSGTFEELPGLLLERFGALGQGIVLSPPAAHTDDQAFAQVVAALQAG
jgi:probable F420-dependent oxidoreductase